MSTLSKAGRSWRQTTVGMLAHVTDLGAPISRIWPWLDMLVATDADVFGQLGAQRHRACIKTPTRWAVFPGAGRGPASLSPATGST